MLYTHACVSGCLDLSVVSDLLSLTCVCVCSDSVRSFPLDERLKQINHSCCVYCLVTERRVTAQTSFNTHQCQCVCVCVCLLLCCSASFTSIIALTTLNYLKFSLVHIYVLLFKTRVCVCVCVCLLHHN